LAPSTNVTVNGDHLKNSDFKTASYTCIRYILRWPTLPELQKAKPTTLEKFFRQHNCRNQQRIEQIRQAIPATQDEAVLRSSQCMVRVYVEQIAGLRQAITE
jgi:hypothetical protein